MVDEPVERRSLDPRTTVSYEVRDLFERQDRKLDDILTKLDDKASKLTVVELTRRVDALETERTEASSIEEYKRHVWHVIGVVAIVVSPIIGTVIGVVLAVR